MDESLQPVIQAFEKCKGRTKDEVFRKLSNLSAADRVAIIDHFEINPRQLTSVCIEFWCQVKSIQLKEWADAEQRSALPQTTEV